MLRRKQDFRPDKTGSGLLNKLYITPRQRLKLLKWVLYILVLVVLSVVQDVILCRVRLDGATTDLVPAGILLLCMMLPTDSCAAFAVTASVAYYFSGSAAGPYSIVFLTGLGVLLNIFRYSYLQKSFWSTWVCGGMALMLYELTVFVTGVFLQYTYMGRISAFLITGGLSVAVMPLLHPLYLVIGKIGGESWKE